MGSDRVRVGLDQLRMGSDRVRAGLDQLRMGLDRLRMGSDRVRAGLHVMCSRPGWVSAALDQARALLNQLRTTHVQIYFGVEQRRLEVLPPGHHCSKKSLAATQKEPHYCGSPGVCTAAEKSF